MATAPYQSAEHMPPSDSLDELEFLSSAAVRMAELGPDADIFQFIADELAKLDPETLVVTSDYQASMGCTFVRAMSGPADLVVRMRALLEQREAGRAFCVDEEARHGLAEGRLMRLEGGLHQLSFHTLPLELSHAFEAELGIRSVYAQPFSRKGDFLGTAALISRAPALARPRLIEAFTRQAAVAIQRLRAETELRESEARFRRLAENSPDVIFRYRLPPRPALEYVSPAAELLTGYTPEELCAAPALATERIHPDDHAALAALEPAARASMILRWQRKDGTYIWIEGKSVPIFDADGKLVAVEGVARDVTARKAAEEALLTADRRKNEFLAVLSHELRNPLTPIRNSLFIVARAAAGGDQARRAWTVIDRQVTYMTRIIDDLLDITRIARGKLELQQERFELNELVRRAVEDHSSIFASGQIELMLFRAPAEVWIKGDKTRIAQALSNLLQNAAKFTPPGGRTSVSVGVDGGRAILRVRDTGAGIGPEILPRVFEPFTQGEMKPDRPKGGLGLGLALVKGLIEMHGGSVSAASEGPGRGAEFTIHLPLAPPLAGPGPETRERPPGPRRVLVIEDNFDSAHSLREVLTLTEHTVELAYSGSEGLEKARVFKPDVVLCDIGLPDMDGYAVARVMRADPALRTTLLIALTGYAGPEDVAKAEAAGFDLHLAKPPSIDTLVRALEGRRDVS